MRRRRAGHPLDGGTLAVLFVHNDDFVLVLAELQRSLVTDVADVESFHLVSISLDCRANSDSRA